VRAFPFAHLADIAVATVSSEFTDCAENCRMTDSAALGALGEFGPNRLSTISTGD
jgi:hypothetical protein